MLFYVIADEALYIVGRAIFIYCRLCGGVPGVSTELAAREQLINDTSSSVLSLFAAGLLKTSMFLKTQNITSITPSSSRNFALILNGPMRSTLSFIDFRHPLFGED